MAAGKRLRREFGRVGEAVDFDQLLDIDVRVNLGGVEPGMSKHLPDATCIATLKAAFSGQKCFKKSSKKI